MKKIIIALMTMVMVLSLCACGGSMTPEEMDKMISEQEVRVADTKYLVQDEELKIAYPDMLQAFFVNESDDTIDTAIIGFVAWDKDNQPVEIEGWVDINGPQYLKEVSYEDINLKPGEKCGETQGFSLKKDNNIDKFRAIVLSYTTVDGETWENPLAEDWTIMYKGSEYTW